MIIVLMTNGSDAGLKKQIDLGYKYLNEQDYKKAVAAFTSAYRIDPESEEALEGLHNTYLKWMNAEKEDVVRIQEEEISLLEELYDETGSRQIKELLKRIIDTAISAALPTPTPAPTVEPTATPMPEPAEEEKETGKRVKMVGFSTNNNAACYTVEYVYDDAGNIIDEMYYGYHYDIESGKETFPPKSKDSEFEDEWFCDTKTGPPFTLVLEDATHYTIKELEGENVKYINEEYDDDGYIKSFIIADGYYYPDAEPDDPFHGYSPVYWVDITYYE